MGIEKQIDVLKKGRSLILKVIENYSLEQINKIPEGFGNNIGWNVAHLAVTSHLLCYKFSELEVSISDEMIDRYKKGTSPNGHIISKEEWNDIKTIFVAFADKLEADYSKGIFKVYNEYTTSVNVTLDSIEKAISFNNFHEGIHLGVILAQKKLV